MDRYLFLNELRCQSTSPFKYNKKARSIIVVQYKEKTTIILQLTNGESILAKSFFASFSEQTLPISSLAAMVNYRCVKAQLFPGGSTPT